jgi:hypothetical protein
MRTSTRRLFGAAALLALCATGLFAGTAAAKPDATGPGDPRAVVGDQVNVDIDQRGNACEVVGLPGDELTMPAGTFSVDGVDIDITANPEGYVLTGVVVKGGPAYNVYAATAPAGTTPLGDLPWLDLHPPLNASGNPAGISHWFVCAEKATTPEEPGEENPGGGNPGQPTTPEETEPAVPSSTTTSPASTAPTTVSTTPAAVAGANDLANTGFDGGWMLIAGLGLVAAGAAFVASPKLRGLLRR